VSPRRPSLERFLAALVERGLFTAVVGLVGSSTTMEWTAAAGLARCVPPRPAAPDTLFDLASLAKPFVATLALRLDALGLLPLAATVGELWPHADRRLARRRLEDLLRHRSGLVPWTPFYARCGSRGEVKEALLGGALLGARRGTYSDLGYLLWGFAAEERLGAPPGRLLRRHVLAPLGLAGVAPAGSRPAREAACCAADGGKEAELAAAQGLAISPPPPPAPGEAQDGNARFLGGCPGHAGLFGAARDLHRLAREWLLPGRLLTRGQVAAALAGGGPHALGWARRRLRGSAGPSLPRDAFGHTGFAGGSLWIDPGADRVLVLLGHRASPFSDLNAARRRFHARAAAAAGGEP
jgi:serine-type D-Ala-D-Ala carboxypeptidase